MNKLIIIGFIFIVLTITLVCLNIKEAFVTSINNMEQNNDKQIKFCKELGYLDKPSEEVLMFLNLSDDTITQKEMVINSLEQQIADINSSLNSNIDTIINNRKEKANHMNKQKLIIDSGKKSLQNFNNPNIVINSLN